MGYGRRVAASAQELCEQNSMRKHTKRLWWA